MSDLLPLPQTTGSVEVQILDGGSFMGNYNVIHSNCSSKPFRCHSWVFYIHHKSSGRHILWDVGLSAVSRIYPSVYTWSDHMA